MYVPGQIPFWKDDRGIEKTRPWAHSLTCLTSPTTRNESSGYVTQNLKQEPRQRLCHVMSSRRIITLEKPKSQQIQNVNFRDSFEFWLTFSLPGFTSQWKHNSKNWQLHRALQIHLNYIGIPTEPRSDLPLSTTNPNPWHDIPSISFAFLHPQGNSKETIYLTTPTTNHFQI